MVFFKYPDPTAVYCTDHGGVVSRSPPISTVRSFSSSDCTSFTRVIMKQSKILFYQLSVLEVPIARFHWIRAVNARSPPIISK